MPSTTRRLEARLKLSPELSDHLTEFLGRTRAPAARVRPAEATRAQVSRQSGRSKTNQQSLSPRSVGTIENQEQSLSPRSVRKSPTGKYGIVVKRGTLRLISTDYTFNFVNGILQVVGKASR